jgi:hypothetical protein
MNLPHISLKTVSKFRKLNQSGFDHAYLLIFVVAFAVIGTGIIVATHAETTQPEIQSAVVDGSGNNYCLNDNSSNQVFITACDGSAGQDWTVNGTSIEHAGQCLTVVSNGTTDGSLVDQQACQGAPGQDWARYAPSGGTSGGGYINPNSEKCLEVLGSNIHAQANIWQCGSVDKLTSGKTTSGTCPSGTSLIGTNCVVPTPLGQNAIWTPTTYVPPTPPAPYSNPLRNANYTKGRIDQGVDYYGSGPVYALGAGEIEGSSTNAAWPSGVFIRYKLTAGPASGIYIYVAEDCRPKVSLSNGTQVTSSTVLCTMYKGADGIETGFAESPDRGWIAMAYYEYAGRADGLATNFGVLFSNFMKSIGGPTGDISKSTDGGSTILHSTAIPSSWSSKV